MPYIPIFKKGIRLMNELKQASEILERIDVVTYTDNVLLGVVKNLIHEVITQNERQEQLQKTYSSRLQQYMAENDIKTITELSHSSGVSNTTLSRYVNGVTEPKGENKKKIDVLLGA